MDTLILYQSRFFSVCMYVRLSIMLLVNASPPKLLDVGASNFAGA